MTLTDIEVQCRAGHKAGEEPRRFRIAERWIEVVEVLDRWHQVESLPEWPRADYFKVLGDDGSRSLLKHDLETGAWRLGKRWPAAG